MVAVLPGVALTRARLAVDELIDERGFATLDLPEKTISGKSDFFELIRAAGGSFKFYRLKIHGIPLTV